MKPRPRGNAESGPEERGLTLVDQLRRLAPRDHAALVFDSDDEAAEAVAAFLRVGLERGERCVHLADPDSATRILPHLRAGGIDAGEALAAGRLALVTDRDDFLRPGPLRPAEAEPLLAEKAEQSVRAGGRALRVSAAAEWLLDGSPTLERLLEYEQMLQRLSRDHPFVGLWRYDRRTLSPAVLRAVLRAHPVLVLGGEAHRNHLFAPPIAAGGEPGEDLDQLLETIAERARAESSFTESGERLRLALEGGAHALWDWDVPGQRMAVNMRWAEIPGLPASVWSVPVTEWEQAIHPDDLAATWTAIRDHLEGRTPRLEVEYRAKHRAGGWRWVRMRGKVAGRDASGATVRLAGTITEVTEVRAAADRALASERFAAVGTLAAGVAHEINNPLAWITTNLGFVEDLIASPDKAGGGEAGDRRQVLEVLEETRQGVARIRDTVEALKAVGRPVAAGAPVPCDVREEVLAAVAVARHEVVHRARLGVTVPDALPSVLSHPGALRKVFLHLLLNAAQAIPEGPVSQHEVKVTALAAAGSVIVEVSDTGVGMSPHVRAQMFDPFFTTKGPGQGMGLGLSFVRAQVEAARGRIEVASEPRRGTTVRVVLPEASREAAAIPPAAAPASGRRRVLVVDDEEILVRAYSRILERDHDVTALTSAADALRRLEAGESWDAILFDLQMPDVDGVELFEKVQLSRPELASRVAFMTGGAFTPRALSFLERNTRPTLAKPIDAAALRDLVAQLAR
jgi:signal transduction histidine kinase